MENSVWNRVSPLGGVGFGGAHLFWYFGGKVGCFWRRGGHENIGGIVVVGFIVKTLFRWGIFIYLVTYFYLFWHFPREERRWNHLSTISFYFPSHFRICLWIIFWSTKRWEKMVGEGGIFWQFESYWWGAFYRWGSGGGGDGGLLGGGGRPQIPPPLRVKLYFYFCYPSMLTFLVT